MIFEAPDGLLVIDTGRHAWHAEAILAFAQGRGRPIAAILNTHWRLDHATGNARLEAAFPDAPLHATRAIDNALAANGFLVRNLEGARAMLADATIPEVQREEVGIFLATMAHRRCVPTSPSTAPSAPRYKWPSTTSASSAKTPAKAQTAPQHDPLSCREEGQGVS